MKIGKIIRGSKGISPYCDVCGTTFDMKLSTPFAIYGGMSIDYGSDCPLCVINNKLPTPKLTQEQIEEKKKEIKGRLK